MSKERVSRCLTSLLLCSVMVFLSAPLFCSQQPLEFSHTSHRVRCRIQFPCPNPSKSSISHSWSHLCQDKSTSSFGPVDSYIALFVRVPSRPGLVSKNALIGHAYGVNFALEAPDSTQAAHSLLDLLTILDVGDQTANSVPQQQRFSLANEQNIDQGN